MATLNLGRIKPVFRGAYNNSTAYVVDDIVTSGGSSYICIQASTGNAVSNATYWTQMAAGGTDVGTTLTTQGDILYRDGSGLARLGAGTSGQLLQSGGSGANVSWTTAPSGKVKQLVNFESSTNYQVNGGEVACTNYYMNITPESTSSKIIVSYSFNFKTSDDGNHSYHEGLGYPRIYRTIGGSSTMLLHDEFNYHVHYISGQNSSQVNERVVTYTHVDSPNTTSQVTYELRLYSDHTNYYIRTRHGTGYTMEIL